MSEGYNYRLYIYISPSHLCNFRSGDQVLDTQLHNVALGVESAVEHSRSHQGHHHLVLGAEQCMGDNELMLCVCDTL